MRGEAQAQLVEADDGLSYVVKFSNNPQGGRRLLVNEFVGSALLSHLGVATPDSVLVRIDGDCVSDIVLPSGIHFGSRYPGTPDTVVVYDFLPDTLLKKVHNKDHFCGALVFDQWMSNTDARQAIFFRDAAKPDTPSSTLDAQMIDNGCVLSGSDWALRESAVQGLYPRRAVYGSDVSIRDFDPWLQVLLETDSDLLGGLLDAIPADWIWGDEQTLERLLALLYQRRLRVPSMIAQAVEALHPMPQGVRREECSGSALLAV